MDPTRENVLDAQEVLTAVTLPLMSRRWRGSYSKSRERTAGDFPIVSLAFGYEMRDGMTNVRLVLGGVAPTPLRSIEAESVLEGQAPSEAVAASSRGRSPQQAPRPSHITPSSWTLRGR